MPPRRARSASFIAALALAGCGSAGATSTPDLAIAVDAAAAGRDLDRVDLAGADLSPPPDLVVIVDSAPDATADEKTCDRLCARDTQTCNNPMSDFCSPACAGTFGRIRKAAADLFIACVEKQACGESTQKCLVDAAAAVRRASDDAYQAACLVRRSACMDSFGGDFCAISALFDDAVLAAMNACLAKPCADVAACMRANTG